MKRLITAMVVTMAMFAGGCAQLSQIDITKLPPIVITVPVETPPPAPIKRATLAFEIVNSKTGAPVNTAFIALDAGVDWPVNAAGYLAFELNADASYKVTVEADDYETVTRTYVLTENHQYQIKLVSLKADPVVVIGIPVPPTAPVVLPTSPIVPPPPQAPACAEFECVRQIAITYAQLLQVNTYESCVEFTQRVLALLGSDWGHIGKTRGEGQSVPRGFVPVDVGNYHITGVSHDAIKHRLTGQVIDLLGNATANEPCTFADRSKCWAPGPAVIQWSNVPEFAADGTKQWRDSNPFVPAVPVR